MVSCKSEDDSIVGLTELPAPAKGQLVNAGVSSVLSAVRTRT